MLGRQTPAGAAGMAAPPLLVAALAVAAATAPLSRAIGTGSERACRSSGSSMCSLDAVAHAALAAHRHVLAILGPLVDILLMGR